MKTAVEVFRDRTYTIVTFENGQFKTENYTTDALYAIIEFLKVLDNLNGKNALCLAACYVEYQGSFNVVVDIDAQREKIIEYAKRKYKTFEERYAED